MRKEKEMLKSNVKVLIDNDVYSLLDAAYLFDYDPQRFLQLVNYHKDGFKFQENGPVIKRYSALKPKCGTAIVRESDGKTWRAIKVLANELQVSENRIAYKIRKDQEFTYKGERYFAPNYKVRTRTLKKPLVKNDIIALNKPVYNSLPALKKTVKQKIERKVEEKIQQLSTEQQCIQLLQKLAVEHIQNAEYDKVQTVLKVLGILTNTAVAKQEL